MNNTKEKSPYALISKENDCVSVNRKPRVVVCSGSDFCRALIHGYIYYRKFDTSFGIDITKT